MATSSINVRVDENLKKDAEKLLNELGLNLSSAINIYLKKMVQTQSIPFIIGKYNAETVAAMREADDILSGEVYAKSYSSAKELFDELDRESSVQFRTDDASKIKAISICERLGIDLATYMRICISKLIQENGIPFSMKLEENYESRGLTAMKAASRIAEEKGAADMALEEINAEISAARRTDI